jgi:CBS-domain-containing membrane protein
MRPLSNGSPRFATPEMIAFLRQKRDEGLSARNIMVAYNVRFNRQCSLNSMYNLLSYHKIQLFGALKKNVSVKGNFSKREEIVTINKRSFGRLDHISFKPIKWNEPSIFEELRATGNFSKNLIDLTSGQCHFTLGGVDEYCGQPVSEGKAYCPLCLKIVRPGGGNNGQV